MEVNQNEMRRLRNEEGLKNPDDVFELSDRHGKELFGEHHADLESRVHDFINDVTVSFQEAFNLLLDEYKKRTDLPSDEIVAYLAEHELDKPRFAVADGDGSEFLARLGFIGQHVSPKEIAVMFQLPKPLAQFWQKEGTDSWGMLGQEVAPRITEWGHFYRELMEVVWEKVGYYESEKGLRFERVNDIGDHDPQSYYYVWKISRWVK